MSASPKLGNQPRWGRQACEVGGPPCTVLGRLTEPRAEGRPASLPCPGQCWRPPPTSAPPDNPQSTGALHIGGWAPWGGPQVHTKASVPLSGPSHGLGGQQPPSQTRTHTSPRSKCSSLQILSKLHLGKASEPLAGRGWRIGVPGPRCLPDSE